MLTQLSNHNQLNSIDNVRVNNKNELTNLLMCNIVLSLFLKPMSNDSKESKSTKLGHRMEKN